MQNKSQEYLQLMFDIVFQAGEIALEYFDDSAPSLKKDASVITKADKAISQLTHEALKDILKDPKHLLLDEEDPKIGDYLNAKRLKQTKYLWAVDPIDGTRLYANRMPMFGISLGVLKDLKPWLGVVYFPVLKEFFYCDGTNAYYVQHAFTTDQKRTKIKPVNETVSPKSLFFCNDTFFNKFAWKDKDFHILINACAVVNLCWPSIGRSLGCFMKSNLWDFAGSWPIMKKAGLDFRSVSNGKRIDRISVELFNQAPKPWELKEYYLVSSQKNYLKIKSKIVKNATL